MSAQIGTDPATDPDERGRLLRTFPAMESVEYRKLFYSAGLSAVSLWALITARGWLAGELANANWAVGVVYFAAIGPWVLAPIGGAFADRFDRARVVMWCRIGAAILAALLAALAFTGQITLWNLILITFLSGVIRSGEMPAQAALLPNTVKMAALLSAITLASMMQFGSRVIGPVAGPVMKELGPEWVFTGAALLLLLSVWQLTQIKVRSTGGIAGGSTHLSGILVDAGTHIREGLRYLGEAKGVRMLIALTAVHCMLAMSFDALLRAFAVDILDGTESEFGYLLMGVGGGALVATIALSMVPDGPIRGRLMLFTGIVSGLSLPVLGLAGGLPIAILGAALAGSSQAMFMALSSVMIQSVVPDAVRGRVMSLYAMFAGGIMALMILANGLAADVVSTRLLLVVPGIGFAIAIMLWAMAMPRLRSTLRHGGLVEEGRIRAAALAAAERASAAAAHAAQTADAVSTRSAPQHQQSTEPLGGSR